MSKPITTEIQPEKLREHRAVQIWSGLQPRRVEPEKIEVLKLKKKTAVYRLVGVENVQLNTSDSSSPFIFIQAIPSTVGLGDKIRNQVEAIRAQKGVREIDVE